MYRDNYSEPINSNMQNMQNINSGMPPGYDYRNSTIHYKQPNNLDNMFPPIHQSHQMYYQNQTVPPQMPQIPQMTQIDQGQQNPYLSIMPVQVQQIDQSYDMSRYYWRQMEPKPAENYPITPSHPPQYNPPPPQMNVVQRISGLIKSQLPALQAIMAQASTNYYSRLESRRHYSRSRSRSKQRHRKSSDSSQDWLCRKCSFSNYDWRDSCKKCNQARPSRSFVPGPEDWKCPKCGNINYARRMECNRCKRPKSD